MSHQYGEMTNRQGVNEQKILAVIEAMHEGESMKKACARLDMKFQNFYNAVCDNPVLLGLYERAQKARSELFSDEILDIADTENDSQKARNRIDARKWYASKMQPQKYGERIDMNVSGTVDLKAALEEGMRRALPRRYPEDTKDAEIVETKQLSTTDAAGSISVAESEPLEKRDAPVSDLPDIFS